ncbi:hypothetical protein DICVIV_05810 [Dictyocaulus viviparus]|uniref:Uncharacterized protein n=1 Tax=Dictyocaulus viviparus TaxID=29172 RepID=A0A0D8XWE6_DICVI|nr:hypothetical protein DICVIV_05810 [Dictyocaulus viviparus]
MLVERGVCTRSPTDTIHTQCSNSLSTDRIYDRPTSDASRKTTSYSSYSTPKSHYDTSSDEYYTGKVSVRKMSSSNSNPYEKIPAMNSFHSTNSSRERVRPWDNHTSSSCSTCPTGSEGSWSEHSSTVSDSTLQNRRLISPKPEPPPRWKPYQTNSTFSQSNPNLGTSHAIKHYSSAVPLQTVSRNELSTPQRSLVNLFNPQTHAKAHNTAVSRKSVIETAM